MLGGCVAPEPRATSRQKIHWDDVRSVTHAIRVQRDHLDKTTLIIGPSVTTGILDTIMLRARKPDTGGEIHYQVYLTDYYHGDWHLYDKASDLQGNLLKITLNSRDVSSCAYITCSHYEQLGLDVSREYLEKNRENGLEIVISGPGGKENFSISPAYIQAFLSVAK